MLYIVFLVYISLSVCTESNLKKVDREAQGDVYKYSMSLSYLKARYSELNKLCYINGYVTFRPESECSKDMGTSSVICLASDVSLQPADFTSYKGGETKSLSCQRTSYSNNQVINTKPKYIGCAVLSSSNEVKSFNQVLISQRHHDDDDDWDDDHDRDDVIEIFGYVLGGIAAFVLLAGCIIAICCVCICKRRKKVGSVGAVNMEMCPANNNCIVQGIPVDNNGQPMYYPPPNFNGNNNNNNVQPIVYQTQVCQPQYQPQYQPNSTPTPVVPV